MRLDISKNLISSDIPTKILYASITGMWSLSILLVVKIVHLVDRTNLFKISNLVYGGSEIVTSLYSSLEGHRQLNSLWWV